MVVSLIIILSLESDTFITRKFVFNRIFLGRGGGETRLLVCSFAHKLLRRTKSFELRVKLLGYVSL